jgi:hypothetical protein
VLAVVGAVVAAVSQLLLKGRKNRREREKALVCKGFGRREGSQRKRERER